MKYVASYHDTELITVTGKTTYSKWFDVSWANELYSYLTFAESETGDSESIVVTLERYIPYVTPTATTVLTHSTATAATNEEKIARNYYDGAAPAADNTIGLKVQWKYISSGTFANDQIITVTIALYAKRI